MVIDRIFLVALVFAAEPVVNPQSTFAKEIEKIEPMLSFPASAGKATKLQARVAYVSNGYHMGGC